MDKALKQRLVGATVLIALAVIVLPMLLSGPSEGTGTTQSRNIELPPRPDDVNFETRRFPLGEPEAASTAPAPAEETSPRLPVPAPVRADPPEVASADDKPVPVSGGEVEKAEPSGEPGVQPAPAVEVRDEPEVEINPPQPAPVSDRPAPPPGRYVVQVASLASEANARKLMESLGDTVASDTGRLSRVRVGPFDSESAANQAARRIREAVGGVNPRVVDLRPDEAAQVSNPSDPLVRWVVQVGSFSEASNAEGLVGQLRGSGLEAYRETVTSSGSAIHRVRVGPFLERQDALNARQKIIDAHSLEGVVMSAD